MGTSVDAGTINQIMNQLMGKDYPKRPDYIDEDNEDEVAAEDAADVVRAMYEDNKQYLNEVLEGVKRNTIVPFIGAGFSAGAYPLWRNFLLKLASGVSPNFKRKVSELLNPPVAEEKEVLPNFEKAASLLCKRQKKHKFRKELKDTFGESTLDRAFEEISFERRGIPSVFTGLVLTTNYDRLLEKIYNDAGAKFTAVICPHTDYQHDQAAGGVQGNEHLLLKFHGDAEDVTHAIITEEDYNRVYGTSNEESALVQIMKSAFESRRALFLGCSLLGDRPLNVLGECREGTQHYALVELPQETASRDPHDPFSPVLIDADGERIPEYDKLCNDLSDLRINPIWYPYGRHDVLDAFLGWLESQVNQKQDVNGADVKKNKGRVIPKSTYELIGRDNLVNCVIDCLSKEASVVFVLGVGGSGKTEVCRKALRILSSNGKTALYVSVAGVENAWQQCGAIADALGVPRLGQGSDRRATEKYAAYLSNKALAAGYAILYLDNWEDAWNASEEQSREDLLTLLNTFLNAGMSTLISSREDVVDYDFRVNRIGIDGLDKPFDRTLFEKVFNNKRGMLNLSDEKVDYLVDSLDGLPLAIVLVATFAATSPSWDDVCKCWAGAQQKTKDHRHDSLSSALKMTWDAISETPLAKELWIIMALLPGDLDQAELSTLCPSKSRGDWRRAFERLRKANLVSLHNRRYITMLRPVREASLPQIADGEVLDYGLADEDALSECLDWLEARFENLVLEAGLEISEKSKPVLKTLPQILYLIVKALDLRGLGTHEINLANNLKNYYQYDWPSSAPVLQKIYSLSNSSGEGELAGMAAQTLGERATFYGESSTAIDWFTRAKSIHKKMGDDANLALDNNKLAMLYFRQGNLRDAEINLSTARRILYARRDYRRLGYAYKDYGKQLLFRGDYYNAFKKLQEALHYHTKCGSKLGLAYDYRTLAELGLAWDDIVGADYYLAETERIYNELEDELGLMNNKVLRARIDRRKGKRTEAQYYLNEAEKYYEKNNYIEGRADVALEQARLFCDAGEYDDAFKKLDFAESVYRDIDDKIDETDAMLERARCQSLSGAIQEALRHIDEIKRLYERMETESGVKRVRLLREQIKQAIAEE